VAVAHRDPVEVGDGQGETGALEQARRVPAVGEGRHPQARAAADVGLRLEERLAQFGQGGPAQDGAHEQPVRLERATDLDKRARKVVGPVQGQERDDQVEAARRKGQPLFIHHQPFARATGQHGQRQVGLEQRAQLGAGVRRSGQRPAKAPVRAPSSTATGKLRVAVSIRSRASAAARRLRKSAVS
jgi:hypothetical protein